MRDRRAHANMRVVTVGKREPKPLLGGLLPSVPIVDPLLNPIIDPIVTPILGGGGGGAQPTTTQPPATQPTPPAQTTAANPPSPTTAPTSPTNGSGGQSGNGQSGSGQSGSGQSGSGQSGSGQSGSGQSGNDQSGNGQSGNGQSGSGQSGNGQSGTGQSGNGNGNGGQGGQSGNGNGTGTGTGSSNGSGQTGNGGGGNSQGVGNGGRNTAGQTGNGTGSQGNSGSSTPAGGNGAVLANAGSEPSSEATSTDVGHNSNPNSNPTMPAAHPSRSSAPAAGSRGNTPTKPGLDGGNNTDGGNNVGGSEGNNNVQSGSKSTGLAPGAIAGIVIACLIALIFAVVLIRRRRSITQRLKRRNQWQHSAVESSTYPFDNHNRNSFSPPPSARSSFATAYDHSIPSSPQMAELRDTHGPGTFSQRNAEFPNQLSPRSPPPVPLLIDIEKTAEFFSNTSPGAKSRDSVNSSSSDPYTMGQVLYTNDHLGLPPQPNTPMSVRPFSPTEAFSFPKPPPSNEFSLNQQQHDDPFADSPTIPTFKPPAVIKRPFNPTKDDELRVQEGDRVSIIQLFDDGWVAVRKVEEHEGKGKGKAASAPGLIPADCFREQGQPLPDFMAGLKRISASSGGYVA